VLARLLNPGVGLGVACLVLSLARSTLALPPPNDTCAGAEVIPTTAVFPFYTSVVDVKDATSTNDPPAPSCRSVSVTRSVWYQFTPPTTHLYTVSVSGDTETTVLDTVMAIYTSAGGCAGPFLPFACNDDQGDCQSAISTTLNAGVSYFIVVWMSSVSPPLRGLTSVQLRVSQPVAPPNDTCAGAEGIPGSGPFPYWTTIADSTLATTQGDPPAPSCWAEHVRSVWFRFAPDATTTYELTLCTNTATTVRETVLAVYTAPSGCGGGFSQLACSHTTPCANKPRSTITVPLTTGVTYYIVAWEGGNQPYTPGETSLQLRVDRSLRPLALTLPASGLTSTAAMLNATANANGLPTAAWFEFGPTTNYGNATMPTNILSGTVAVPITQPISVSPPGQTNHFRVVATNSAGTTQGMDRSFAWSATPPRLTSSMLTNGGFVLRFTGQSGQVYFIDTSVNLVDWASLGMAADLGGGSFLFTNANELPSRFYRARSP